MGLMGLIGLMRRSLQGPRVPLLRSSAPGVPGVIQLLLPRRRDVFLLARRGYYCPAWVQDYGKFKGAGERWVELPPAFDPITDLFIGRL